MISVAAIRMQQFGVQFYQASLSAAISTSSSIEVLSYGEQSQPVRGGRKKGLPAPPRSIGTFSKGASAPTEGVSAPESSGRRRRARAVLRAVSSGARSAVDSRRRHHSCDEALRFEPMESGSSVGTLKVPEREGILRAIDGQHRLLALHADIDRFGDEPFTVPAVIFDRLPDDHVVQMFVTINAKHTRLNASHLVSLSGRQLYRDENLAVLTTRPSPQYREDSPCTARSAAWCR